MWEGWEGRPAPIHLLHQAHRTRRARGRAFHPSHRTPPPFFLPHSGPQTRGTTPPRRRQAAEKTKNGRKPTEFAASPHHRRPLSYPLAFSWRVHRENWPAFPARQRHLSGTAFPARQNHSRGWRSPPPRGASAPRKKLMAANPEGLVPAFWRLRPGAALCGFDRLSAVDAGRRPALQAPQSQVAMASISTRKPVPGRRSGWMVERAGRWPSSMRS